MALWMMLFWILTGMNYVYGQHMSFHDMRNTVDQVYTDLTEEIKRPLEVYNRKILDVVLPLPGTVAIMQNASTRMYIFGYLWILPHNRR